MIKQLILLKSKSRERKKQLRFVVEGERELSRALEMSYYVESIFYREDRSLNFPIDSSNKTYEISNKLFDNLSIRSGSEEVLAIVKTIDHGLNKLIVNNESQILVIEAPEKPGNIGAVLRTAAAAALDAVIIANPRTDIYHPNIIRNSLGGVFSIPIAIDNSKNVISFLKKNDFQIVVAAISSKAKHYKRVKYKNPLAIILGSEDKGINDIWIKKADKIVQIPVKFPIDSLNLSVSAGILIYHCNRD